MACRLLIVLLIVYGFLAHCEVLKSFDEKENELIKTAMFDYEHLEEMYALQTKLKCCGAENYLDYNGKGSSSCFEWGSTTCTLPASCFKAEAFQTLSLQIEYGRNNLTATWKYGDMEKAAEVIHVSGCSEILRETFRTTSYIILGLSLMVAVVQTLLYLLVNYCLYQLEQQEENPMEEYMHYD